MAVVVGEKVVIILFVGLLMAASLTGLVMYKMLDSRAAGPETQSHDYAITGTLCGESCSGTGVSEYAHESDCDYLYNITFNISNDTSSRTVEFGFIFDHNGVPKDLYSKIGSEIVGEHTVDIWSYSTGSIDYTFYTGDHCTMQRILLSSAEYTISATMVGGYYE